MSGVVNKPDADKAVAVKADELIRKPFQPQELIGRVKSLLAPKIAPPPVTERRIGASSLQTLFAPPAPPPQPIPVPPVQYAATPAPPAIPQVPSALTPLEKLWPLALG